MRPKGGPKNFFDVRVGHGEGPAEFAGSRRCLGCHEDVYLSWRDTLHATTIQDVQANPDAIVADFTLDDPHRTIDVADVAYTIGGEWMQRFITVTADISATPTITVTSDIKTTWRHGTGKVTGSMTGGFYVLPAEWHF